MNNVQKEFRKKKAQAILDAEKKKALLFVNLCQSLGAPTPQMQFRFHPERKWKTDFYFEANGVKLALEVEGGIFTGGRHTRPAGFVGDLEKYNALTLQGIFLIRVSPKDLLKVDTVNKVKAVLQNNHFPEHENRNSKRL